jgi:hypothetical protein
MDRSAVLPDLMQGLNDERVLTNALVNGGQAALPHKVSELRRLLKRLGILRRVKNYPPALGRNGLEPGPALVAHFTRCGRDRAEWRPLHRRQNGKPGSLQKGAPSSR